MQTIAIFNTRGGSGKSAVTVFLADFLATAFSKRVLVVDLDPQQSSSVALLGDESLHKAFEQKRSLPRLMFRVDRENLHPNAALYHVIERPKLKSRKHTLPGTMFSRASERIGTTWTRISHTAALQRQSNLTLLTGS